MQKDELLQLPASPEGKTGWPWNVVCGGHGNLKEKLSYPKISVVIPSYNQGGFIEETLRSIICQDYPLTEIIIIDGGSTDETLEIIEKYKKWITYWKSEKDRGQSHAVNKGFEHATGDLVAWQNSDDLYTPGSFLMIAQEFLKNPAADVYFGNSDVINKESRIIYTHLYTPFSFFELKYYGWNITNQSSFFRKTLTDSIKLNENYHYAMDADFYFRIASANKKFRFINKVLGQFRIHDAAKSSLINIDVGLDEWIEIRQRHGIIQKKDLPWPKQFVLEKAICLFRRFMFYLVYGNLFKKLKMLHSKEVALTTK